MWGDDVVAVGWFRKMIGNKMSEDGEAPVRYVSALDGKDISKLFGTAAASGPTEPWVVAGGGGCAGRVLDSSYVLLELMEW